MKPSTALIPLALYAMLIGSAHVASAQPFSPADYFPLVVGNHWEYETIWNGAPDRWTYIEVLDDTTFGLPGETVSYKVQWSERHFSWPPESLHIYNTTFYSYSDNGDLGVTAFDFDGLLTVYDSLVIYLRNPITVGDSIHFSIPGSFEGTSTVISLTDTLNLPLGQFENCLLLHDSSTFNGQLNEVSDYKYIPISYWPTAGFQGKSLGTHWYGSFHTGISYLIACDYDTMNPAPGAVSEFHPALIPPFNLVQNYPNPFNPSTTISFSLPKAAWVNLRVYDLLGRSVAELVNRRCTAGVYRTAFDGANAAAGVYVYQLKAGDFLSSGKMVLLK